MVVAGTGGKPALGEQAAQESVADLEAAVNSADMVAPLAQHYPERGGVAQLVISCYTHCCSST